MANQIRLEEMVDVLPYFRWLNQETGCDPVIGRILYDTDFRWPEEIPDDKNRAEDGLRWRDRYAETVGDGLDERQRDRIRKSIHGKACCYEVILSLAEDINEMVNEETESKTAEFFGILLGNLGLKTGVSAEKTAEILAKWLDREDEITLFPVTVSVTVLKSVTEKVSQWMQMNRWLEVHSDENGHFVTEKCNSVTVLK